MAHLLYTLGIIVAIGAALAALPKIWQAVKWLYWLIKRIDDLSHLGPVIVGMAQQFQRNGGASMKDAVVAIKEDVAGVKGDVAALKDQTNKQDDALVRIEDRQDKFEKELARLIYHEANNDLHSSNLRKEAEKMLGKPEAPPDAEAVK